MYKKTSLHICLLLKRPTITTTSKRPRQSRNASSSAILPKLSYALDLRPPPAGALTPFDGLHVSAMTLIS